MYDLSFSIIIGYNAYLRKIYYGGFYVKQDVTSSYKAKLPLDVVEKFKMLTV